MSCQIWRLLFMVLFPECPMKQNVQAKLSGIEQRLQRLHNDYIQVDSERDFLADLLRRFHISVGQTIGTSKDGVPTSGGQGVIKSTDKFDTNEIDAALRDLTKQIERLRIEHVSVYIFEMKMIILKNKSILC